MNYKGNQLIKEKLVQFITTCEVNKDGVSSGSVVVNNSQTVNFVKTFLCVAIKKNTNIIKGTNNDNILCSIALERKWIHVENFSLDCTVDMVKLHLEFNGKTVLSCESKSLFMYRLLKLDYHLNWRKWL